MATLGQEGHPAAGLLLDLGHGLVVQQVGQAHAFVAHVVAEPQVAGDVHALRLLGVEAPVVDVVRLPAVVVVLLGRGEQKEEEEGEGPVQLGLAPASRHSFWKTVSGKTKPRGGTGCVFKGSERKGRGQKKSSAFGSLPGKVSVVLAALKPAGAPRLRSGLSDSCGIKRPGASNRSTLAPLRCTYCIKST